MKTKPAPASSSSARGKRIARKPAHKVKLTKAAGARPLTRKSDLIDSGYTGDRGNARSATSGIP